MQVRRNPLQIQILMLQDTATVIFHPMCHASTALMVLASFMHISSVVGHAIGGSILNALGVKCT
jgi:hypothetical protein